MVCTDCSSEEATTAVINPEHTCVSASVQIGTRTQVRALQLLSIIFNASQGLKLRQSPGLFKGTELASIVVASRCVEYVSDNVIYAAATSLECSI
jgi:hypothetical protein